MSPIENHNDIARIDERVKSVVEDVDDIKRELYGNGNRGLKTAMTELRQAFRIGTWVAGIIAGALVLDLSSRAFQLVSGDVPTPRRSSRIESSATWTRDAASPRNDPRAAAVRALRRRVDEMGDDDR